MRGSWLAYCMSGNDCSSLEWITPIVYFLLTLASIYFARKEYLTKIKPVGFIPRNIVMMVFYISVPIGFFTIGVASLVVF